MQNQRIQELMDEIDQKEDTINKFQNLKFHMENTLKGSVRIWLYLCYKLNKEYVWFGLK